MPLRRPPVRWLAAFAVVGAFIAAAVAPPPDSNSIQIYLLGVGADKWLHAAGSAGLAVALAWALRGDGRSVPRTVALVLGCSLAFGAGSELLQTAVPARNADLLDFAADAIGAAAGAFAWWVVGSRRRT